MNIISITDNNYKDILLKYNTNNIICVLGSQSCKNCNALKDDLYDDFRFKDIIMLTMDYTLYDKIQEIFPQFYNFNNFPKIGILKKGKVIDAFDIKKDKSELLDYFK